MNPRPESRRILVSALLLWAMLLLAPGASRAESPQERLNVGLKAFRDGFHGLAAKELRAFLEAARDDPRRPEVLYVLAQAEIAQGHWDKARKALERLSETAGPRAREARYWLGWVAVKDRKRAEARGHLDAYLKEAGGERRADALYLAAELARDSQDFAVAAERFSQFLETAPADQRRPHAWLKLVEVQLSGKNPSGAQRAAQDAVADAAVRADRVALEAVSIQGITAAGEVSDPRAEAGFWKILAGKARQRKLRARARFEEGMALLRAGDPGAAHTALQTYLETDAAGPYAGQCHLVLADLSRQEGDRGGALDHLEAALSQPSDPAVAEQLLDLRKVAFSLALDVGDESRVVRHAQELLKAEDAMTPEERGLARYALAQAAAREGHPFEAVAHWDEVPPGTSAYRNARVLAAQTLVELDRPAEALEQIAPLLGQEDPGSEAHMVALAAAEAAGDAQRAAALCAVLAERPPSGHAGAEFLYRRALHLKSLGDDAGCAAALEAFATRSPEDPRAPWAAAVLQDQAHGRGEWESVLRWAPLATQGEQGGTAAYLEADALWKLGRLEQARKTFLAIAQAEGPFRAQAWANLGAMLDAAGGYDDAENAYRAALEAGLDEEASRWVRDRLEALSGDSGGKAE